MSDVARRLQRHHSDTAPGDERLEGQEADGLGTYLIGFALAAALTVVSFLVARTTLVWQPSIPVALCVLAVAQMGVHLVFFLHINTGPDGINNIMALAFGVLIVFLVVGGSMWIIGHMNNQLMPMDQIMGMQR